jgi:hypothetical protein
LIAKTLFGPGPPGVDAGPGPNSVFAIKKDGTTTSSLGGGANQAPTLIATGGYVYWTGGGEFASYGPLERVLSTGGTAEELASDAVTHFAVQGSDVYFATYGNGEIHHAAVGSHSSDAIAEHQFVPTGIACDAARVVWWNDTTITVHAR